MKTESIVRDVFGTQSGRIWDAFPLRVEGDRSAQTAAEPELAPRASHREPSESFLCWNVARLGV
jgi:hypothetical protein